MKKTELIPIYDPRKDREGILRAGDLLRAGGLVAVPTETVYGLAADAFNPRAVEDVYLAKGRPRDNPMIVHIADRSMLKTVALPPSAPASRLADAFWPGPLTLVLPKAPGLPGKTTGGLDSVAVRMPGAEIFRAVIDAAGTPLAAPSANRSGSPSPTTCQHCVDDLWGRVDAVVMSGPCPIGVESTVVSMLGDVPVILRPGAVTPEQIRGVAGSVRVADAVLHRTDGNASPLSPGMKYRHYSPKAVLRLIRGGRAAYARFVNGEAEKARKEGRGDGIFAMCFDEDVRNLSVPAVTCGSAPDYEAQARALYDVLRELDRRNARLVYVHAPEPDGIGLAVYNRLLRAAAFDVVEV